MKDQLRDIMESMNGNYGKLEAKLKSKFPILYESILSSWSYSFEPKNFVERCYLFINDSEHPICQYNKRKKFEYFSSGYVGCSKSCQCVQDKRKQSMIDLYGVHHALQHDDFKEKAKKTWSDKYGTTALHEINVDQKKKTNNIRYGADTPLASKQIQEKIAESAIASLGVDKPFKDADIRKRAIETIEKKYGVKNVLCLPENIVSAKNAILNRYGVESSFSLLSIREKIKQTMIDKYGVEHISQQHIDPDKLAEFKDDQSFTDVYTKSERVSDVMEYYGIGRSSVHRRAASLGLPVKWLAVSEDEQALADFVSEHAEIEQTNRTVLSPKEIDIWLPTHNVGIEYNGLYYHSDKFKLDRNAHLSKTQHAERVGIRLIHVFSDEWIYKTEIVKSRILNLLGKTPYKLYARKCSIVEVSSRKSSVFLEANHIQGTCASSIRYGLAYDGELVALMTFGKVRFNKHSDWELLRFCSKTHTNVIGGAGKLLSHFMKNHSGKIVSYADKRWSDGNLYKSLGFKYSHDSAPNYFYVKKDRRESRNKYQKHKLHSLLEHYDDSMSESENMRNNGFYRIYDCGNSVWVIE